MTRKLSHHLIPVASLLLLAGATTAMAEESLLWKTLATNPAVVVPAFTNQHSPFPQVEAPVVSATLTVDAAAIEEQQRQRDKAFGFAEQLIKNGKAMRPELRSISVGGMVEGRLGPRVLVNNQWVGVGAKVPVRQVRSADAIEALKVLAELDASASTQLTQNLNSELSTNPVANLVVQSITSTTLLLKGPDGLPYKIGFNINSQ